MKYFIRLNVNCEIIYLDSNRRQNWTHLFSAAQFCYKKREIHSKRYVHGYMLKDENYTLHRAALKLSLNASN